MRKLLLLQSIDSHWSVELLESQETMFRDYCKRYQHILEQRKNEETACDLRVLRSALVVGFTTSGAASHQELFRAFAPRIVVSFYHYLFYFLVY
jgi:hypothetical protein